MPLFCFIETYVELLGGTEKKGNEKRMCKQHLVASTTNSNVLFFPLCRNFREYVFKTVYKPDCINFRLC